MNNRSSILNCSKVYDLQVKSNCVINPVEVNLIIRDETSEMTVIWKFYHP